MVEPKITFRGFDKSDKLTNYALEKIQKHENLLERATKIEVELTDRSAHKGVAKDFGVEVNVDMPNAIIRAEGDGHDFIAMIDKVSDILARRLKRYKDKSNHWEGEGKWEVAEVEDEMQAAEEGDSEEEKTNYIEYVPKIHKRVKYEDCTPIQEAEAVERMELLGHNAYLFKSADTGKFTMLYKNERGRYVIVEPKEG